MKLIIVFWIIGWVVTSARESTWDKDSALHYLLMFLVWPIVLGVDVYSKLLGEQQELISKLRARLIAEEDARSTLEFKLLGLHRYNFESEMVDLSEMYVTVNDVVDSIYGEKPRGTNAFRQEEDEQTTLKRHRDNS